MNKIALRINVCADDWTAERAIIASIVWVILTKNLFYNENLTLTSLLAVI